ncbi:MAG: secondary thiamine-phosphate synthase enzyme YjbQ, partial [Gammaproteobacteria bacterium]|nr:secondary thiamine-phosphate synthase enzyme YjbQ [Gammaproteobacteria bacterium]
MIIHNQTIELETVKGISLNNISDQVCDVIATSKVQNGVLTVNSMHTTTALCINEFESRLLDDVRLFFHDLVPPQNKYLHNDIHLRDCPQDEPENAHAHLLSMLLGNSESIIICDGVMQLGRWQSLIML